ncbi:hypothetical protein RJT34_20696 [Clitoria ternatea]|uniref:Uncharacterized protein n=1 Tax=Clitoria ternatea TaxID=43366 RepID=A0AAN9ITN5_CLITE
MSLLSRRDMTDTYTKGKLVKSADGFLSPDDDIREPSGIQAVLKIYGGDVPRILVMLVDGACIVSPREVNVYTIGDGINGCHLVDPASSHMLVSKIKPCMYTVLVSTINNTNQGSADVTFKTLLALCEKSKSLGMVARLKLKGINGKAPSGIIAIVGLQRGIPSKRESSARVYYVPALCTQRLSLLPIEWSGEVFGLRRRGRFTSCDVVRS